MCGILFLFSWTPSSKLINLFRKWPLVWWYPDPIPLPTILYWVNDVHMFLIQILEEIYTQIFDLLWQNRRSPLLLQHIYIRKIFSAPSRLPRACKTTEKTASTPYLVHFLPISTIINAPVMHWGTHRRIQTIRVDSWVQAWSRHAIATQINNFLLF
jgi:hypothetical protein